MPPGMPPGMGGPPMGGPPMGGPPMGGPPMRPMRRGTSKAIPVVVSAGLAVGVFCGLLFGVGTGKSNAAPAPAKGNNVSSHTDEMTTTPVTPGETQNKIVPTDKIQVKGAGSNAAVATGSAAGSAAGAGSAVAAAGSAAVAPKTAKLTIKVQPDAAATAAKIQVDGKDIDGTTIELPLDKKSVKITVTSSGYHQVDKQIDILGDETTVELPMTKRAASPGFGGTDTHKPTVPTRPPGPDTTTPTKPKKKPGGLIDI